MKKISIVILLTCLGFLSGYSQKLSVENVHKLTLRSSDAIKEGSEIKGYYFFYISDKIDKKTNEYTLKITDNNLNKLKDIKFEDSKDVMILESSFNGTDLIFLFYNDKERTFEYQVYGANGNKKHSYSRELSKKEKALLESTYLAMDDDENTYKGLYPIEGQGFISNTPSRETKDYTFELDYFSSATRKQWSYIPTEGAKKFVGDYLGCSNGVVYIEVLKWGSLFDQKPDSYLVGLDLQTGKQLFENLTDKSGYRVYPASMSLLNNGKAYIFGEYFDGGANIMKDKSNGYAFWEVDTKGNIVSDKYCSWENDMGKYLNVSSKGKIEDFGFMYLHNITQTADGSIFAVGEGFKKVVSALGMLAKIASRGNADISTLKIKVTDMILIEFDKDFKVKSAKIYPKNSNNIELRSGYEFVSTPMLGKLVKYAYGGFDYDYTQINKDLTSFSVCYHDYVKGKDYKGGTFNSISYNEGKITTDKINTKSDATRSWILPGKQGQVLIMDYYKKEKKLEGHFEKLN